MVRDARARQALAAQAIDPGLPLAIVDLARRAATELRHQHVSQRSLVTSQRCRGVARALLPPATTDGAGVHAVKPLVSKLAERRTRGFGVRDGLLTFRGCRQPAQHLRTFFERVRPHHPPLAGLPAATAVGRLASASTTIAVGGGASSLVADVERQRFCSSVLRHSDLLIRVHPGYAQARRDQAVLLKNERAFSRAHRRSSSGGTWTSAPHGTTRMKGCTRRSNVSTLIPNAVAASSRVYRMRSTGATGRCARARPLIRSRSSMWLTTWTRRPSDDFRRVARFMEEVARP